MKKLFKPLAVVLAVALIAATGCTKKAETPVPETPPGETPTESTEQLKVGILQIIEHDALDASREGFLEALAANGYVNGENIVVDFQNAQGDQSNLKSMSQKFIEEKNDLILAIGTPAAIAIATETKEIPIVVTAVTDPAAANLVVSNEKPETNVTGTSDMAPYKDQVNLMKTLLPYMDSLAIVYTSSEDNSVIQANLVEEYAAQEGIAKIDHKTVSSTNDIDQVLESLSGQYDAVYLPTDNTLANAMATVASAAVKYKLPVICAEEGMATIGGLASVSINYKDLGYSAGEMAVKILKGEAKPQDMPIQYAPSTTLIFNAAMFEALSMDMPEDLKATALIVNEQ